MKLMNKIWGAYLDDYYKIKVIIPRSVSFEQLLLVGESEQQELWIEKSEQYGEELHLYTKYKHDIALHKDYDVVINTELKYHLSLGKITRSISFDVVNYYEGPLGIEYHESYTIFRVWSPVAKELQLILKEKSYDMKYLDKGLWQIQVEGDYDKAAYFYRVRINETWEKVLDPYAISSSANHEYNYVIDWNKTYKMKKNYCDFDTKNVYEQAILYEINFRDLGQSTLEREGAYSNAISKLPYFAKLGVTHLQLMPCFAFGGVNEKIKDSNIPHFKYNWGYNPIQYNVPSGWYSSNPDDPYARVNELKQFIDAAHEYHLGVVMDVVFNHVYDYQSFSLGILVPGYVYRTDGYGFLMNSSYCGNDIRTEGKMNRKFILDTLLFWQKYYHMDGFRFDLMGLIDSLTIQMAKEMLTVQNLHTILYGEGWYMNANLPSHGTANLGSAKYLYPVSFFNDYFRNEISGHLDGTKGFVMGEKLSNSDVQDLICHGSLPIMPFKNEMQSINYIECHDNYTFRDKLQKVFPHMEIKKIKEYCKLGLALVLLSAGIPFIHGGEELMRSKKGHDNSYNSSDDINHFPWENIETEYDLYHYVKTLISFRKIIKDKKRGKVFVRNSHYEIRYEKENYQVIIKNNYEEENLYFSPYTTLLFDNDALQEEVCSVLHINHPGVWILKK